MYSHPTRAIAVLLLGSLLFGLAHIALLPPFEGFDETAHYSYIQQVAETGRWPRHGDKMSRDIDDYLRVAPSATHGPWTYRAFFAAPPDLVAAGRRAVHARPAKARRFAPGAIDNWQAQHPPLYYAILAPAYLVSTSWSLGGQLLLLRALSYLIAWAGLCIVTIAALRAFPDRRIAMLLPLGAAMWPTILPGWFPEMGRLGNDSLVVPFAAFTFILLYRVTLSHALRDYALLGIVLGFALLTKATFLPVVVATFVMLAGMVVCTREREQLSPRLTGTCISAVTAIVIGGWWYLLQLLGTGSAIGSNDEIRMRAAGGLIAGLTKHLDLQVAAWAPWDVGVSFLWSGTWSFVLPPRAAMLPIMALAAGLAYGCCRFLRQRPREPIDWFAPLVLALFMAALAYHSVILLSIVGTAAPAWYLHSLAPILALPVGYGMAGATAATWPRRIMSALLLYTLGFLAVMTTVNALYFAGCGPKLPGRLYIAGSTAIECLADYPRIYDNLAVLAFPGIGILLFVAGWMLLLAGVVFVVGGSSTTSAR